MALSALQRAIDTHRSRVRAIDRTALARVFAGYQDAMDRLQPMIELLQQQASQQDLTPGQVMALDRYQELERQIVAEMDRLAALTGETTRQAQSEAVTEALRAGQAMAAVSALGRANTATVVTSFVNLPERAFEDLIGATQGGPLKSLLDTFSQTVSQAVVKELTTGLALGQSPRKVADAIAKGTEIGRNRALAITRTETLRSLRSAAIRNYQGNSDVLRGWIWTSAHSSRTCAACLAMDGTKHEMSEPFEAHVSCFVAGTMVSGPRPIAGTERWYSGDVIEIETKCGRRLTVTPNHPILTTEGWIAAGLLNEGHNLISGRIGKRNLGGIDGDDDNVPSPIEEIAKSLRSTLPVVSVSVPTSPKDFHGDGFGSEVCVVRTDRQLWNRVDSALAERLLQPMFVGGRVGSTFLAGQGGFAHGGESSFASTHSNVSRLREFLTLLRRSACHSQQHTFTSTSRLDSGLGQIQTDRLALNAIDGSQGFFGLSGHVSGDQFGDWQRLSSIDNNLNPVVFEDLADATGTSLEAARDLCNRLAGSIAFDHVTRIYRRGFEGHVYNLETVGGWYFANGIIAHNCRCSPRPWLRDVPMQRVPTGEQWLKGQDAETQDAVLGRAGGNAFRSGQVALGDFVRVDHSIDWGASRRDGGVGWALAQAASQGRRAA